MTELEKAAMRMALEALQHYTYGGSEYRKPAERAITALTQALATAEPVQAVTPTSGNILIDALNEVQALKQQRTTTEPKPCTTCSGMGYVDGVGDACTKCSGDGDTTEPSGVRTVKVRVRLTDDLSDCLLDDAPTERKGEPIGEIVRSFGAGSGLEVRLLGGLTSDTPGIVGTKLYTSPQVPPHILGLTQGITGALNHLVLMIAGRAKAFPSLPLGRYLPEALHFAGLEMPSREACRPMTFNVPTVSTLTSAIAGALSGTWHCMRVWEAWHHGTMSEDDFEPVAESETPREIAEIVAGMYALAQGGSLDEAEEVPSHG